MRHSNLCPHALVRPDHVAEAIAAGTVHGMNTFESGGVMHPNDPYNNGDNDDGSRDKTEEYKNWLVKKVHDVKYRRKTRLKGLAGLPRSNGKATLRRLTSHSSI